MKIKCVTGAPGSGKSTYVEEHIGENDIAYDYDKLYQAMTLKKAHSEPTESQNHVLNRIRYDVIRACQNDEELDTLWMISSKPSEQLKEALGDDCEYIELEVDSDEAKERIDNDDSREDKEAEHEKVDKYFEEARTMMKEGREYRSMRIERNGGENKDFMVRGYASTFEPYVLYSYEGIDYSEKIDRNAFDDADLSDVIFLYNHEGMVHARRKNGTLNLGTDAHGLWTETDLSSTTQSREVFEAIDSGLVDQMSFAFTVTEDAYDRETHTRTILKIGKVYDVSAVSIPANPGTDIAAVSARDYFNGVIEMEKAERLEREKQLALAKAKFVFETMTERK